MRRFIDPAILLWLVCSGVCAEEYLVRVEGVGYQDVPVSEKVPVERSLYGVEVIAVPNQLFRSRTLCGPETLLLEGELKPGADGSFSADIKFCREVDTGCTVPKLDGTEEPVLDVTSTACSVTIKLGQTRLLGGMETQFDEIVDGKQRTVKSKVHHVLMVSRRKPGKN